MRTLKISQTEITKHYRKMPHCHGNELVKISIAFSVNFEDKEREVPIN